MNAFQAIDNAIAALCDDICGDCDAAENKTRAEAIAMLTACLVIAPKPSKEEAEEEAEA